MRAPSYTLALAFTLLAGCLPESQQAAPGTARITVTSDTALTEGFETADGWRIEYERALLAIGAVRLWSDLERGDGRRCSAAHAYSSEYIRLLDARRAGAQLLATPHGLGPCEVGLQIWGGSDTVVLGEGVEEGEADRLRSPGGDAFVPRGPISLHVAGRATRGDVEKRFDWAIRQSFDFERCASVTLEGGAHVELRFELDGAALFRESAGAAPSFDALAELDGDDDGWLTVEELATSERGERLYRERSGTILIAPDRTCEPRRLGR